MVSSPLRESAAVYDGRRFDEERAEIWVLEKDDVLARDHGVLGVEDRKVVLQDVKTVDALAREHIWLVKRRIKEERTNRFDKMELVEGNIHRKG